MNFWKDTVDIFKETGTHFRTGCVLYATNPTNWRNGG